MKKQVRQKTRSAKICCECKNESISRTTRKRIEFGIVCMQQWGYCTTCKMETEYYNYGVPVDSTAETIN